MVIALGSVIPLTLTSSTQALTTPQAPATPAGQTTGTPRTTRAIPPPPPAPTTTPPPPPKTNNGIPQGNGGDQDADINGGPSDGDGNL
jgi:hypothetical protein